MSFEEEFDNIIRQKAEEAGFPFDEKNWEKMSGQLDADRKKGVLKGGKKTYLALILLVLSAVFTMVLLNGAGEKTSPLAAAPVQENMVAVSENSGAVQPVVANSEPQSSPELNREAAQNEKTQGGSGLGSGTIKNPSHLEYRKNAGATAMLSRRSASDPQPSEIEKEPVSAAVDGNDQQNDVRAEARVPAPGNDREPAPPVLAALPAEEKSVAADPVQEAKSQATGNGNESPESIGYERLTMISTGLSGDADEKNITSVPVGPLNFYDHDFYKKEKFKTSYLNVEAGGAYLLGWQAKNTTDGKGFNWFAGMNYGLYLSEKTSAEAGLQVYTIGNIKQPFYTATKTEFGFGSVRSYTVITARSLYYLAIPVKFSYAVNGQNQLGVGANLAWLANSANNVETFGISENGKIGAQSRKKGGVYEGIATTNLMLSAFYRTKLSQRLAVNGEFVYGLTDIFKNTTTIRNNETALGFRLSLQYTLFDK